MLIDIPTVAEKKNVPFTGKQDGVTYLIEINNERGSCQEPLSLFIVYITLIYVVSQGLNA